MHSAVKMRITNNKLRLSIYSMTAQCATAMCECGAYVHVHQLAL